MDNRFNKVFPSFDPFNKEFSPGSCFIDIFSNHFSFYLLPKQDSNNLKAYICSLNDIVIKSSLDLTITLIVSDASIRNQVTTSILHIHIHNRPIIKMLHHTVNNTSTEAELFAIRYGINQATNLTGINKIIIITDSIHSAKRILNYSSHPFQIHMASISHKLRNFFDNSWNNVIEFWECPSCCEWSLYRAVNRETKTFQLKLCYLCKLSWDFSKKRECDDILNIWKMTFQASNKKGHHFLDLLDDDNKPLEPTCSKDGI